MPQMNPIFWSYLMISFILILITTNTINYFYLNKISTKSKTQIFLNKNHFWKW